MFAALALGVGCSNPSGTCIVPGRGMMANCTANALKKSCDRVVVPGTVFYEESTAAGMARCKQLGYFTDESEVDIERRLRNDQSITFIGGAPPEPAR